MAVLFDILHRREFDIDTFVAPPPKSKFMFRSRGCHEENEDGWRAQ